MMIKNSVDDRKPTPVVEDPHPGSISDGTHPEAAKKKSSRSKDAGRCSDEPVNSTAKNLPLEAARQRSILKLHGIPQNRQMPLSFGMVIFVTNLGVSYSNLPQQTPIECRVITALLEWLKPDK